MPNVTIDGKTAQVPPNTMVVEAAKALGVHIPVFCYHPKLEPVGMCRMCLVEVGTPRMDPATRKPVVDDKGNPVIAWIPKLQAACTTAVSEGMAVRTNTHEVAEARRSILEFLLTSHPLDCPICDKGGECPLQDHTLAYGPGVSRFRVESKFHNEKRVPLGPLIMLDRERCIQCSRCIRFQDEFADDPVLGFAERGRALEIVTLDHPPFNSKFSGNTIDICPVGALTSRDFRFSARVFELNDKPSVCPHCSVGCNILVGERDHVIRRITPRENETVNEIWLCDKGRFVNHFASSPERLTRPLMREGGELVPVSWYDAITAIGSRFNTIRNEYEGKAFAGLAGDRVANEDLYLFQKLFREIIGSNNLDHRVGWSEWNAGEELVRNLGAGVGTNLGELGKNTTLLVVGADPEQEQPVIRLRLSKSARLGANLIVANGRLTKLAQHAKQSLIYRYGAEAYFLLGLLRALAEENLFKTELPGDLKNELGKHTIDECADRCGIRGDVLSSIARGYATSENALLLFGRELMFAMQQDPAVESIIAALVVATGHLGRKDNGVIGLYPHNNSTGAFDMGITPERGAGRVSLGEKGLSWREIVSGKPRALYVMGCDPARDAPGFRKANFLVVQDLFLTETAKQADIVLPAQSWAEREGTFTNTERRVQLFRQAIAPCGEARPDWMIVQEIAVQMGARWDYRSPAEVTNEIAARVPLYAGLTYERLAVTARRRSSVLTTGGESVEPVQIALGELYGDVSGSPWRSVAEGEPNAKFDLQWIEPGVAKDDASGHPADAPKGHLYALAVARSLYDRGTLVNASEIVQSRVPPPTLELNSHDAEDLGLEDGMAVRAILEMKPPRTFELNARVDGHVPPGVVLIPNNLDGTYNLPMGVRVRIEKVTR